MAFNKITEQDVAGLGVTGLADVPGLTTADMQAQFDEYSVYLKRRFNQLIEELESPEAAANIGTAKGMLQDVLDEIEQALGDKAGVDNILTKDNTEPYTPTDDYNPATKKFVEDSMVAAGAGDMASKVYDPQGRKEDIFAAVDRASDAAEAAQESADRANTALGGCWIAFTDEDGNPTDEPYIHWMQGV